MKLYIDSNEILNNQLSKAQARKERAQEAFNQDAEAISKGSLEIAFMDDPAEAIAARAKELMAARQAVSDARSAMESAERCLQTDARSAEDLCPWEVVGEGYRVRNGGPSNLSYRTEYPVRVGGATFGVLV